MNVHEARRCLATYLVGGRVSPDDYLAACSTVRTEDPVYWHDLCRELGLHEDWASECAAFLENMAEFAEMSPEQRRREGAGALGHLEICRECRKALWEVAPVWLSLYPASGSSAVRRLGEPLVLRIQPSGRLADGGIGLPAEEEITPVAAAAGWEPEVPDAARVEALVSDDIPQAEPAETKRWAISDPEAQCVVSLAIRARGPDEAALWLDVEPAGECRLELADAQLAAIPSGRKYPAQSGPLRDFRADAIILPRGSWIVRVSVPGPEGGRVWEVPLELEVGPSQENAHE
jgi:hypothetical protein